MKRLLALLVFLALSVPAVAQWQVPVGAVPVGRGAGVVGFGSATGATGLCLMSNGLTTTPTFQTCPGDPAGVKTLTNTTYDTAGTGNSFLINGVAVTGNTGTGLIVRQTSPTLITPTLGVAAATSINGNFFTAGTYTLTGAGGKTFTFNNTMTATATDGSSIAFGTGGTVLYNGGALGTPSSGTLTNTTGLPISTGVSGLGTGVATALAANTNATGGIPTPTPTRAGDIIYWNGSNWVSLAGNNSGTLTLQENGSGVPSWASVAGTGTVTSVVCGTGLTGGTITTTGTCAVSLTTASNVLGADVALNNTANYFDGPSMAQGTSGTWWVSGTVTVTDTAGVAQIQCKLWDGTTVISSGDITTSGANTLGSISLHGFLASPAANIKISCKDVTATTGKILFNQTGNSKDSSIWGHRIQ